MPDPQPQALHQSTRLRSRAHSAPGPWPTSLAPPLAPGGLSACHGVHRPRVQGQGSPPGQATRRGRIMTEATVSFAGNLTDQPKVRYTEGGIPRAMFRVAVSGRREQEASIVTVIVWRDQAEHAAQSLSKGSRVVVVGRLQQRTWTTEDGSPTPPSRYWPRSWARVSGGRRQPRRGREARSEPGSIEGKPNSRCRAIALLACRWRATVVGGGISRASGGTHGRHGPGQGRGLRLDSGAGQALIQLQVPD
jgi:single-stranded DNA-binding protein